MEMRTDGNKKIYVVGYTDLVSESADLKVYATYDNPKVAKEVADGLRKGYDIALEEKLDVQVIEVDLNKVRKC